MDVFYLNIYKNLHALLQELEGDPHIGSEHFSTLHKLSKESVFTNTEKELLLEELLKLLLVQPCQNHVISTFSCLISEFYYRLLGHMRTHCTNDAVYSICGLSLKLLNSSNIVIEQIAQFIEWVSKTSLENFKNKTICSMYQLIYFCLMEHPNLFKDRVSLEILSEEQQSSNINISWYATKVMFIILNTPNIETKLRSRFPHEQYQEMLLHELAGKHIIQRVDNKIISDECNDTGQIYLSAENFKGNYALLFGILFKKIGVQRTNELPSLTLTQSTLDSLKSMTIGVATNTPVLLTGETGCGKSTLVEAFASYVGRNISPNIIKLQLGEATDSKSLVGTYICSGSEFHWQAGTLTQALQHGSWLLLEDVNTAPVDVISMLVALCKSNTLQIPGRFHIRPAPGFQIFATSRTKSGSGNSTFQLFSKLCYEVKMKKHTLTDLVEIVKSKFPKLENLSEKIVDIYALVSADDSLHPENNVENSKINLKCTSRDMLKWCSRIDGKPLTPEFLLSSAIHVFCSSLVSDKRFEACVSIGVKLGLNREKVEYYLNKHKPRIDKLSNYLQVGDTRMPVKKATSLIRRSKQKFAFTRHSLNLLENILLGVVQNEPLLLVGETGGGKTSTVQFLAEQCRQNVVVVNMSQQSDISDLIGGFKPIDARHIVHPLKTNFEKLFNDTFPPEKNVKFLGHLQQCFENKSWDKLLKLIHHCTVKGLQKYEKGDGKSMRERWENFRSELEQTERRMKSEQGLVFDFVEGALVECLKNGSWLLLDEINLASSETLEYLSGLLDSKCGSLLISERGDTKEMERHPDFRFFACMNPATDVGKKSLPYGIQNRFTQIYVDEISEVSDLTTLIGYYLQNMTLQVEVINGIVRFYKLIREKAKQTLVDGSGQKPHFSLRTLCRGLQFASNQTLLQPLRAVYEGLCLSFLTQLERSSYTAVEQLIKTTVFNGVKNLKSILKVPLPKPKEGVAVNVEGYWLRVGSLKPVNNQAYVITRSVQNNLKDLARIVSAGSLPILIQGETSVGKTSLITYLSQLTGNYCVRINNHEHTDIQEYIGSYGADDKGNLLFKEGVLVSAMRQGHWIILDELNLAPTDVLEALNRLLDDNRELFLAETQETVKAHPQFMLFATQNPPHHYGGRKVLSRAFRNRFVELHYDEIPRNELEEILHQRCQLPTSYCKKFVNVMCDLQVRRASSGIFAGKRSFMTLRDLFRWAERYRLSDTTKTFYDWEQCICEDGFLLLAGRCRKEEESDLIKMVLEGAFKKKINLEDLYSGKSLSSADAWNNITGRQLEDFGHVVWTENMRRLSILVSRALSYGEAVLLVGETGCGKTTICQILAALMQQKLYTVNCHMHSEASDFLGGLRPVRSKDENEKRLFEWCDGPLVNSMEEGAAFLIDEISLAEDSVLERLNSVLEPERTLVLAEKGENCAVVAAKPFRLLATMNPGGDFGKKELSPALRNRFTEIWCPASDGYEDLVRIIDHNISNEIKTKPFAKLIVEFIKWFKNTDIGIKTVISIRDILSWVRFMNATCATPSPRLTAEQAYIHGACMVLVDSIGTAVSTNVTSAGIVKKAALEFLSTQVNVEEISSAQTFVPDDANLFGIHPFFIEKGPVPVPQINQYRLDAKTTLQNGTSVLRGLSLPRPILLEGSPGVGKTSLVIAIAKLSGHNLTRINLSEETDVSDLFGADLPVEEGGTGKFAWRDGPLLKALKNGDWVIFDELNLASQSVLEGLNACFDHRGEIFVPELNKSFEVRRDQTKIFACQNPYNEGSGRKGLPKSFLNRFTKVYVNPLDEEDLVLILSSLFKNIGRDILVKVIKFNETLHREIVKERVWGTQGSPWEFNVRDMIRWCELLQKNQEREPGDFVPLLYLSRVRTTQDREKLIAVYERIFEDNEMQQRRSTSLCSFQITQTQLQLGFSELPRTVPSESESDVNYELLRQKFPYMECVMKCIEMNWMTLVIGYEDSGKKSLVNLLSQLTGSRLHVLSMNSSMDTMDIIGSFEQVNRQSDIEQLAISCIRQLEQVIALNVHNLLLLKERQKMKSILKDECKSDAMESIHSCLMLLQQFHSQLNMTNAVVETLLEELKSVESRETDGGSFHWVDGILLKAIKNGDWLLIENANFCSSAVLDRLNGLLEADGVLTVDEHGAVGGKVPQVSPHPDFRMFMTVNPKFGEISRAMRNRGVEIFMFSKNEGIELDIIDARLLLKSEKLYDAYLASTLTSSQMTGSFKKSSKVVKTLLTHGYSSSHALQWVTEKNEESAMEESNNNIDTVLLPSVREIKTCLSVATYQRNSVPLQMYPLQTTPVMLYLEKIPLNDLNFALVYLNTRFNNGQQFHSLLTEASQKYTGGVSIQSLLLNEKDKTAILRLYFQLVMQINKFFNISEDSPSPMSIMHQSYNAAGKSNHRSLVNLHETTHSLLRFVKDLWLKNVAIGNALQFAQVELGFSWLFRFVEFCNKSPMSMLGRLLLHWRWLAQLFLPLLHGIPDELTYLLGKVNTTLQHKCNKLLETLHVAMGTPNALLYQEQHDCIERISKVYESIENCVPTENTREFKNICVELCVEIWSAQTKPDATEVKISVCEEVSKTLAVETLKPSQLPTVCKTLFLSSAFTMVNMASGNFTSLLEFAQCWNVTSLFNQTLFRSHEQRNRAHMISSIYKELLNHGENKAVDLRENVSFGSHLVDLLRECYETTTQPKIQLKHVQAYKGGIGKLCTLLWSNANLCHYQRFVKLQYEGTMADLQHNLCNIGKCLDCVITDIANMDLHSLNYLVTRLVSVISKDDEAVGAIRNILEALAQFIQLVLNNSGLLSEETIASLLCSYSGFLTLHMSKPVSKFDVVEENKIRLAYLKQELEEVTNELELRYEAEFVWCGVAQATGDQITHYTSNPQRVQCLLAKRKLLTEEISTISTSLPYRPDVSRYNELCSDFEHYVSSVGNDRYFLSIIQLTTDTSQASQLLGKLQAWSNSTASFIQKLQTDYVFYQDLTLIPITALQQCRVGFSMMADTLRCQISIEKCPATLTTKPSDIFNQLFTLHQSLPQNAVQYLTDQNFYTDMEKLSAAGFPFADRLSMFALESSLERLSETCTGSEMSKTKLEKCQWILNKMYHQWSVQKYEEHQQTTQNEALYKFRTQCEQQTEDEKDAQLQQQLFPTFDDEFSGLQDQPSLENQETTEKPPVVLVQKAGSVDAKLVLLLLKKILLKQEMAGQKTSEERLLDLFVQIIPLLQIEQAKINAALDDNTGQLFVLVSQLYNKLTTSNQINHQSFNIYTDHCVSEVLECRNILNEYADYVKCLSLQFEDHPALKHIEKVIEHLLSLSLYSPLMKFVTGLEFLLGQSNSWEEYAASHVSLKSHLQIISNKVLHWRKAELSGWMRLLELAEEEVWDEVSVWWFQFYNLLSQTDHNQPETIERVVVSMKQFCEHSTVGEYKARLELLETLQCWCQTSSQSDEVYNAIWNTRMYYAQFQPAVDKYIADMKKPIQKQLQDFVKITKWNDTNYFALRETISRAHRTLRKYVRQYKKVLQEPVAKFFNDQSVFSALKQNPLSQKSFTFNFDLQNINYTQSKSDDAATCYLDKTAKLQYKMRDFMAQINRNLPYGSLVQTLDEFTGDVIQGSIELQKDETDKLPKEKQKAARANLQKQKRKALSSLFKELKKTGVSYRKGELHAQKCDDTSNVPAINLLNEGEVEATLKSANELYFACIGKYSIIQNALCSPSKELGPHQLTRFKGYTNHLLSMSQQQRCHINTLIHANSQLKEAVEVIKETKSLQLESSILPPQQLCQYWKEEILQCKCELQAALEAVQTLLHNCPQNTNTVAAPSPFPQHMLTSAASLISDSQRLDHLKQIFNTAIEDLQQVNKIDKNMELYQWKFWMDIKISVETLKKVASTVVEIPSLFTAPDGGYSLIGGLTNALEKVNENCEMFSTLQFQSQSSNKLEKFVGDLERLVEGTLLSTQSLVKHSQVYNEQVAYRKKESESELMCGHIAPLLTDDFLSHLSSLRTDRVLSCWQDVAQQLRVVFKDCCNTTATYSKLFDALPLLQLYSRMVEWHLANISMLHRTTNKLLSVLYNIFTDLTQKGFCTPSEEETTTEGEEGVSEFTEPSGMGEGQGAKDVSDQIESEDQVEDTKHEGQQEEKQDDEENVEEEKEGIEMTDDFDSHLQDVEGEEQNSSDEDENEDQENKEEDRMGDVDESENTLDQKMWSDNEDEDEQNNDESEEQGKGAEGEKSELVANEDNSGAQAGEDKRDKEKNKDENNEDNEINEGEDHDAEENEDFVDNKKKEGENEDVEMEVKEDAIDEREDGEREEGEEREEEEEEGGEEIDTSDPEEAKDDVKDEENLTEEKSVEKEENEEEEKEEQTETEDMLLPDHTPGECAEESMETTGSQSMTKQHADDKEQTSESAGKSTNEGTGGQTGQDDSTSSAQAQQKKAPKRKGVGKTNEDRTLDESESVEAKKRKAQDNSPTESPEGNNEETDTYEHIKDDKSHHDQLIVDSATQSQQLKDKLQQVSLNEDEEMEDEESEENLDNKKIEKLTDASQADVNATEVIEEEPMEENEKKEEIEEEMIQSNDYTSNFYTSEQAIFAVDMEARERTLEKLREDLESGLVSVSQCDQASMDERTALEMWMQYERLTSGLAQQLCEQLRLVLEPTLASKLKGDYRTGKRINMRKVIPYIASRFRKDKIWLRRTKKSKRKYQIVLAVDDSSSMTDNHSKQLAFESIAVISSALKLLEAGDLALCSFGEDARLVHPFGETFCETSGANMLRQFSFRQTKTNISKLLRATSVLLSNTGGNHGDQAKLLLIVSDGRGIYLEGKEVVLQEIRTAREAGIFVVFIIIDNPKSKHSVLDIKVPIFPPGGGVPIIRSYMEQFPFPFYVVLRNINSLPLVLGDALRQWFELVAQPE